MEKIRDLDECVETEKARATSLREVSYFMWMNLYLNLGCRDTGVNRVLTIFDQKNNFSTLTEF